jgi:hypothetical protein
MAATRTGCDVMGARRLVYGMSTEKRKCGERLSDSIRMTKAIGWHSWTADTDSICDTILHGQCASG